jgi:hypothetical protein
MRAGVRNRVSECAVGKLFLIRRGSIGEGGKKPRKKVIFLTLVAPAASQTLDSHSCPAAAAVVAARLHSRMDPGLALARALMRRRQLRQTLLLALRSGKAQG